MLYADDTICVCTDIETMNKLLASIEVQGAKYGMKLNRSKCEVFHNANVAYVHFMGGSTVKKVDEATYLGCQINDTADIRTELGKRVGKCIAILDKLHVFGRRSNCPVKLKLLALDVVIRTKVLHGLESAQLGQPQLRRLGTLHLKCLSKILQMSTTFVDRANTNAEVYRRANEAFQAEGSHNRVKPLADSYKHSKTKSIHKILKQHRRIR